MSLLLIHYSGYGYSMTSSVMSHTAITVAMVTVKRLLSSAMATVGCCTDVIIYDVTDDVTMHDSSLLVL